MKRQLCSRCERPIKVCYCHCLTHIKNHRPIWILQHHAEKKHAIGTAKIVELSLNNVAMFSTKNASDDSVFQSSISSQVPILVYPGEDAISLDELKTEGTNNTRLRPLLFLDGSWRKTHKMLYDFPELNTLTKVSINPTSPSRYRIRKEPKESAISTLEAIVYTLEKLEGDKDKYKSMLDTMDWMIDKQIEHMGKDVYLKNYKKGS